MTEGGWEGREKEGKEGKKEKRSGKEGRRKGVLIIQEQDHLSGEGGGIQAQGFPSPTQKE